MNPSSEHIIAKTLLSCPETPKTHQVYGGKVNGSMLAGRNFLGRESVDVESVLIFGDVGSAGVTRRAMALLDACYTFAHKAGLLTDEAVGLKGRVDRVRAWDGHLPIGSMFRLRFDIEKSCPQAVNRRREPAPAQFCCCQEPWAPQ